MHAAIKVDEVPRWVPGKLTLHSPAREWPGLTLRGYSYPGHVVDVPPLRDYLVIGYRRGSTLMRRRLGGPWSEDEVRPGDVTLLTSGAETQWEWPGRIDVIHSYVRAAHLEQTCRDMFDREISGIELTDTLRADDPHLFQTLMNLAREAREPQAGWHLVVDALTIQLGVQLLRNHARIAFAPIRAARGLTSRQLDTVTEYMAANLHRNVTLDELAGSVSLSRFHFSRQFRAATGKTPHEFVLRQRLDRVRQLLRRSDRPISAIAHECGFADQSHLSRVFRKHFGLTPGDFRAGGT
ncbi:helix-turn-helix domain-containing protein [Amycolatopsis sp. GA6-003]|uniref:helix-turn-helix domain-containing protein n=1 Tax=Amycolatopsis sp. GA6-003 TaxID=2652444 RepID=UPI0039172771